MTRITRTVALLLCCASLSAGPRAQQNKSSSPGVLLQQAHQKATIEADLPGAIAIYKEVVSRFSRTDRTAAATATLKIAECYERLRDPQAHTYFQQVLSLYADHEKLAAVARQRVGSGTPRQICEQCGDIYGAVSPDGKLMATVSPFFGGEHSGAIGILDLVTQKITRLDVEGSGPKATGVALSPRLSPDLRHVAYLWANAATKRTELRLVSRDEPARARVLVNNPEIIYIEPHGWSADGRILVVLERPDRTWEIGTVSASTGSLTRVQSLQWRISGPQHETSFSPDSRYIAYAALTNNPSAPIPSRQSGETERQIYIVAADGSGEAALTTGAGAKRNPVWTPDGSHVVYLSNVSGSWAIWAVPVKGGKPSGPAVLARSDVGGFVASLGISRDGRYHYYQGREGVFRTTIASSAGGSSNAGKVLNSFPGARPSWSPDGASVAVTRTDGAGRATLFVHELSTGAERAVKTPDLAAFPFSWYPDSKRLLVVGIENRRQHWYTIDVSSERVDRHAAVGTEGFNTHANVRALAPDGRTVYLGTWVDGTTQRMTRIVALDLQTGAHRDVFTLPGDTETLPGAAQDIALAISPDGRTLAILHRDRTLDRFRLATVGTDGHGYREIVPPFQTRNVRTKLAWTRDGWIYFPTVVGQATGITSADTDVYRLMRVRTSGGSPEPVGVEITGLERFDVHPDGNRVAYSVLVPEGAGESVWSLDVASLLKTRR